MLGKYHGDNIIYNLKIKKQKQKRKTKINTLDLELKKVTKGVEKETIRELYGKIDQLDQLDQSEKKKLFDYEKGLIEKFTNYLNTYGNKHLLIEILYQFQLTSDKLKYIFSRKKKLYNQFIKINIQKIMELAITTYDPEKVENRLRKTYTDIKKVNQMDHIIINIVNYLL